MLPTAANTADPPPAEDEAATSPEKEATADSSPSPPPLRKRGRHTEDWESPASPENHEKMGWGESESTTITEQNGTAKVEAKSKPVSSMAPNGTSEGSGSEGMDPPRKTSAEAAEVDSAATSASPSMPSAKDSRSLSRMNEDAEKAQETDDSIDCDEVEMAAVTPGPNGDALGGDSDGRAQLRTPNPAGVSDGSVSGAKSAREETMGGDSGGRAQPRISPPAGASDGGIPVAKGTHEETRRNNGAKINHGAVAAPVDEKRAQEAMAAVIEAARMHSEAMRAYEAIVGSGLGATSGPPAWGAPPGTAWPWPPMIPPPPTPVVVPATGSIKTNSANDKKSDRSAPTAVQRAGAAPWMAAAPWQWQRQWQHPQMYPQLDPSVRAITPFPNTPAPNALVWPARVPIIPTLPQQTPPKASGANVDTGQFDLKGKFPANGGKSAALPDANAKNKNDNQEASPALNNYTVYPQGTEGHGEEGAVPEAKEPGNLPIDMVMTKQGVMTKEELRNNVNFLVDQHMAKRDKAQKKRYNKKPKEDWKAKERKLPSDLIPVYDALRDAKLREADSEKELEESKTGLENALKRQDNAKSQLEEAVEVVKRADDAVYEAEMSTSGKWNEFFHKYIKHRELYGEPKVSDTDDENVELRKWIKAQRKNYKDYIERGEEASRFRPLKYWMRALEEVDFIWNRTADKWQRQFDKMLQYKEINGHCCIPKAYQPDKALGAWVHRQRYFYKLFHEGKPCQLTQQKIELLNDAGFVWSGNGTDPYDVCHSNPKPTKPRGGGPRRTEEEEWSVYYNILSEFYTRHGHTRINTESEARNNQLRDWVSWQRKQWKLLQEGKPSLMTEERMGKLESLGFQWVYKGVRKRKAISDVEEDSSGVVTEDLLQVSDADCDVEKYEFDESLDHESNQMTLKEAETSMESQEIEIEDAWAEESKGPPVEGPMADCDVEGIAVSDEQNIEMARGEISHEVDGNHT